MDSASCDVGYHERCRSANCDCFCHDDSDVEPMLFTCECGEAFKLLGAKFRHMQTCEVINALH